MSQKIEIEKRLISTHLSKRPLVGALAMAMGMLLICLAFSLIYWRFDPWAQYLAANYKLAVEGGEYWRLMTSTFVHGDIKHLLSNAYMLGILSYFVYGYFGFWVYPFTALFLSAWVNYLTLQEMHPKVFLIGASGMVYLLAGFWLTIYIFVERQRSIGQRIVRALGVAVLTLFPTTFEEQVSYLAHWNGLLVGVAFAFIFFFFFKDKIRQNEKWKIIIEEPEEELESFY